jgi:putative transcriptional regulator
MDAKALIRSLDDVARFERGEIELKTTAVIPPMIDVKKLRSEVGLSQNAFASRFGFSTAAIRNWEQGLREPEGPARTLLALIERNPKLIENEIKKLRTA